MINYFTLKPIERIKLGYLKWTENHQIESYNKKYLHIIGIYRWISGRKYNFTKEDITKPISKVSDICLNASQLDLKRFGKIKRNLFYLEN